MSPSGATAARQTLVEKSLATICSGCEKTPTIRVLNKVDAVDPALWGGLKERYDGLLISAQSGDGLQELLVQVERHLFRERAEASVNP